MDFRGALGKFFGNSSKKPASNETEGSGGIMDSFNSLFQNNPTEVSTDNATDNATEENANIEVESVENDAVSTSDDDNNDSDDDSNDDSNDEDDTDDNNDERDAALHFSQVFKEKIMTPSITVNCVVYFPL